MNHAHHPNLFSSQWLVSHPDMRARLKGYGPALALGALLAIAAFFVWNIYVALDVPLMDANAMSAAAEELFVPTGLSSYLPPQF